LYLTLILPDGSRAIIPASWTNLGEICPKKYKQPDIPIQTDLIATASNLLHLHEIIDGLLDKLLSWEQEQQNATRKERHYVKTDEPLAHKEGVYTAPLEKFGSKDAKFDHSLFCQVDQTNCLSAKFNTPKGGQ
jgi:hypothetical protein